MARRDLGRRVMEPTRAVSSFNPLVLAPTYDNAGTLIDVLDGVAGGGLPMLIVNDGSTDATGRLVDQWLKDHPHINAKVLTHARNRGKAAALRTGFAHAI